MKRRRKSRSHLVHFNFLAIINSPGCSWPAINIDYLVSQQSTEGAGEVDTTTTDKGHVDKGVGHVSGVKVTNQGQDNKWSIRVGW